MFYDRKIFIGMITASVLFLSACGSDNSATTSLSGFAQKGPFLTDSEVTLCKVDEKLLCTAETLTATVTDNNGSYSLPSISWNGQSKLTISGYYFDEVTGETSLSPATISAIVDIKSGQENSNNANVLTHLYLQRVKGLVDEDKQLTEAFEQSKADIKALFNVQSDDFSALNLTDFSEGKASVNAELLRLSAAVAKSSDPVGDLEALIEIYNDGGFSAVLNSSLYQTLMDNIVLVDIGDTLTMLGVDSSVVNAIDNASLDIAPFAKADMHLEGMATSANEVVIHLFGTTFINDSPSIMLSSTGDDALTIVNKTVSVDKKSVILEMDADTSCSAPNLTFSLDYIDLEGVDAIPLQTNSMSYFDPNRLCSDDDNDNGGVIISPINHNPIVSINPDQNINITAGDEVTLTSIASDEDGDTITTSWKLKETNATEYTAVGNVDETEFNYVFSDAGSYVVTVEAQDEHGAVASAEITVTVTAAIVNHAPIVSISPAADVSISTGESVTLTSIASDQDGDTITTSWKLKETNATEYTAVGNVDETEFNYVFSDAGSYVVTVEAQDEHGAVASAEIAVTVTAAIVNHAPIVSISPAADVSISTGESVTLTSIASDEDGDNLVISWKLKENSATTYTTVANFGETGFTYEFNDVGIFIVAVEAKDEHGAIASANITVTVTKPAVELADINLTVMVKGTATIGTSESHSSSVMIDTQPTHGNAEAYLVGGETWYFKYEHLDCFTGQDSFTYKVGNDYGRVIVIINSPSTLNAIDISRELFNTETVSNEYLSANTSAKISTAPQNGVASLAIVGGEDVYYSYAPNSGFVGNDFFDYTLDETINECSYSDVGRVEFNVKAPATATHLFTWDDATHGSELWKTDGEVDGTVMIKDLNPGAGSGASDIGVRINGINYFAGNDGISGSELYKTDGTESGTTIVKNINPGENDSSLPGNLSVIGDYFYFFAMSGDNDGSNQKGNKGLWQSDGTEAGTQLIEDFGDFYGTGVSAPGYLHAFNHYLMFLKDEDSGNGANWEPWVYDTATSSLSIKLKDIWPGSSYGSGFKCEVQLNGLCYGRADNYTNGTELWMSDGTTAGTQMIIDLYPGKSGAILSALTLSGDQFFFTAFTEENGVALWQSDGTASGTTMVKDHYPDDQTTYSIRDKYGYFTDVNGVFYFRFWDDVYGPEVWKSDGTADGTVMVKDAGAGQPQQMINVNGTLYFWYIDDDSSNSGLWKSDGTETGTTLVKSFPLDEFELNYPYFSTENGMLYIKLLNYSNGYTEELWRSNGTESGTFKLLEGVSMGEFN